MKNHLPNQPLNLTEREKLVLDWAVRIYVQDGLPVASQRLSGIPGLEVSSATIRKILFRLETLGLLTHPHTSAGRTPTQDGYRYYVDHIMAQKSPDAAVQLEFELLVQRFARDLEALIEQTSHFLGEMSSTLVLISMPNYLQATVRSINLVELDFHQILIVVQVQPGPIKTAAIRVHNRISRQMLKDAEIILNEQYSGKKLSEIITPTPVNRVKNLTRTDFVQQLLDNAIQIFRSLNDFSFKSYGTHQLFQYPEFVGSHELESIMEVIEAGQVYRLLPAMRLGIDTKIMIGDEIGRQMLEHFSLVSHRYQNSLIEGTIHLLGPTRMAYERICGLVEFTAQEVGKNIGVTVF